MPNPSTKKYTVGTMIMQEGTAGYDMFILVQGSVGLYKNFEKFNQVELDSPRVGGFFSEMSLFMNQPREATAIALSDCMIMTVDSKNARDIFSKQPDLAVSIMTQMCRKFDALSKKYDKLNERHNPAASAGDASRNSTLFPPEHGSYNLPLTNDREQYLYKQKVKCPMCEISFENLMVLSSRLRRESTDKDLRVHYAEIEPMFYDVASCPNCLFSAPLDIFTEAPAKLSDEINQRLNRFLSEIEIKTGDERDSLTVFAGYYLALRCVPVCYDEYQLILAGLWQKLSRIYKDCGDEKMYIYASENAAENYDYVYQNFYISEKQSQQICYILGDLYERLKDYDRARNFFFLAKQNRLGSAPMRMQADRRLDDLKVIMGRKQ